MRRRRKITYPLIKVYDALAGRTVSLGINTRDRSRRATDPISDLIKLIEPPGIAVEPIGTIVVTRRTNRLQALTRQPPEFTLHWEEFRPKDRETSLPEDYDSFFVIC